MFDQPLAAVKDVPVLSNSDFEKFRRLAHEKFGLNLTDSKHELVAARLGKKLGEMNLASYQAYYELVLGDRTGESLIAMIDALSTNHTSFLRESAHFDFLRTHVLPALSKRQRIDVWSAPCSTGEEVYSIAITMLEELGAHSKAQIRVLGTDISTKALATAKRGVYNVSRLTGLPMPLVKKYFSQTEIGVFEVRPELRRLAEFERVNLVEPIASHQTYPLIFCRNMMIYFDKPTQERVVRQLNERLEPGGYLFIGHSESLMGIQTSFEYVKPAIYRKPQGGKK